MKNIRNQQQHSYYCYLHRDMGHIAMQSDFGI